MTRIPRDLSGESLVRALQQLGYERTRQTGSHLRLSHIGPPQHHVTVPLHDALRIGTLAGILDAVAVARYVSRDTLLKQLFA